jgi:outer membrane protein assembly factor BamB
LKDPDKTEYSAGEEIMLTAVPESNYEFVHWEGADIIHLVSENPINITIPMSISITAVFNMGMQWSFDTGGSLLTSPAIATDGTIYIVSAGKLYAINPDGSEKWSFSSGYIDNSPSIGADGTVYVGSGDNNLYAVYPNGTENWSYPLGNTPVT